MRRFWKKLRSEDAAHSTVEFAMLLMLISLAVIAAGPGFSARVAKTFLNTSAAVSAAATASSNVASSRGEGPKLIGDSGLGSSSSPGDGSKANSHSGTESRDDGNGRGIGQGPK